MIPTMRRFYFDNSGHIFFETNVYGESTIETEISNFKTLSERNRETFDVLELPFGAYQQDFAESNGYRVNVDTKELEFSYPDPNAPTEPPVYQAPLSEEVSTLKTQIQNTQDAVDFLLMNSMPI